ncbi:stemmadenine O-acetyltransferase-like [Gastrolobium bilobum]|uniref:stemmadenine O-acetyltransferase-like n=1 Tax=Gastrolobium bilobum TaxID=150636 RepID=UPI002AB0EB96|nr:stemmadenine O-acetyltransferase-like [Gastrolobium bilobum]
MEMKLISRETIKPSVPTPPHLRIYPLSFIDHIVFRNYVPTVFFYSPNECHECDDDPQLCDQTSKISSLKKSLSEVLSRYYPFAGRFRDQLSIDCNDEGVSLLVTRIRIKLSEILQNPKEAFLNPLFPDELQWKDMSSSASLVAVQINSFACGGMAISVCMCHKVGDASTLFNFVNDWATMNRDNSHEAELLLPYPALDAGVSIFPQGDLPVFPEVLFVKDNTVCRRFVFKASKIESLKAMVSSHKVKNPTRVDVVTALVYKCAVSALGLTFKTTSFRIAVNLRKRMVPPPHEKCVGNMVWFVFVFNPFIGKRETELHDLVSKVKQGLSEFCEICAKKFGGKDLSFISECLKQATSGPSEPCDSDEETQTLFCYASWCRFPMYVADFGWGKPIWVTTSGCPVRNSIVLMDTRDGDGIEALVNMEEHDMVMFERDVELLQYASLKEEISSLLS